MSRYRSLPGGVDARLLGSRAARQVRIRPTGDFGWGVLVENGASRLVSYHETRPQAEHAARQVASALKYPYLEAAVDSRN